MNVLVTGASGYIGRWLVEELIEHGYRVKALLRRRPLTIKEIDIFYGDITNPESFISALDGIDAVFHNAAIATDWGNKREINRVNIDGTKNIAEMCRDKGVDRIIFTSSAGVYGFPNKDNMISEDYAKNPLNAYHKSKLIGEKILKKYENIDVSIIRPSLVLGGGGKAGRIIFDRIKKENMVYIGSGNQYISIVHPKDVAQCLRLALEKGTSKNNIFNVVSFICTIRQIFEEISHQINVEPPRKHVSYPLAYSAAFLLEMLSIREPSTTRFRVKSLGTTRKISCERAKKELGYRPKYDLQSTVKDILHYYHELNK